MNPRQIFSLVALLITLPPASAAAAEVKAALDSSGHPFDLKTLAIGDGARFGGAQSAQAQGKVAAWAIANDLGFKAAEPLAARRTVKRAARFQSALWELFAAEPMQPSEIRDEAIVCRCEEVTAGELRRQIAAGHDSPAALKRATRAGMGRCQGRFCGDAAAEVVAHVRARLTV